MSTDIAVAQVPPPVHPSVADATNAIPNEIKTTSAAFPDHPPTSPMLNIPDATWNHGEEASALPGGASVDEGGLQSWRPVTPVLRNYTQATPQAGANVYQYQRAGQPSREGWQAQVPSFWPNPATGIWRLRGYLGEREKTGSAPPVVDDAGFEVLVPAVRNPNLPTILIVNCPNTMTQAEPLSGNSPDFGIQFAQPAWYTDSGVESQPDVLGTPRTANPQNPNGWCANPHLLAMNEIRRAQGTAVANIISVRVMPRTYLRPWLFQMQRNLEIVRAVRAMFTAPPDASWLPPATFGSASLATNWDQPLSQVHTMIEGYSFGGLVAALSALLFSDEFHGAASFGAVPSPRAFVSEGSADEYLAQMTATPPAPILPGPRDMLYLEAALRLFPQRHGLAHGVFPGGTPWSPFFHASAVHALRKNVLRRPIYLGMSDEDFISRANEVVPWLSGQREWVPAGTAQNSVGGSISWSMIGKNCHNGQLKHYETPVVLPPPPPVTRTQPFVSAVAATVRDNFSDATLDFLPMVLTSATTTPTLVYTPPLPSDTENATEDPYEHFLQQAAPVPAPNTTTSPTNPLVLDATFAPAGAGTTRRGKSFGIGVGLGAVDSMIWAPDPDGGPSTILVGSSDGVVSKLDVVNGEVVPLAMSEGLGFGAHGIAVGEADGAPGKEILVATHRGLHALYREDLSTLQQSRRDLPWRFTRLRRLKVADFVPGGYAEVVAVSDLGTLVVFDAATFTVVGEYFEPGIVDIEVLDAGDSLAGRGMRIALLSVRGHVIVVEWDPIQNLIGAVATSARLNGEPLDLERCDAISSGGPALAVLMGGTIRLHTESLWILDAATLAPRDHQITGQYNSGTRLLDPTHGVGTDLEICSVPGFTGFIMLRGPEILALPYNQGAPGTLKVIPLGYFPPLLGALDLAVDPLNLRLFVSTRYGYVCWLPLADLSSTAHVLSVSSYKLPSTGSPTALPGSVTLDARRVGVANAAPTNCNRTLAATWGMVQDGNTLQLIDQSGTRWMLSYSTASPPVAQVTMLHEVGHVGFERFSPMPGPYRALRKVPTGMVVPYSSDVPPSPSSEVQVGHPPQSPTVDPLFADSSLHGIYRSGHPMAFAALPALQTQEVLTAPFEPTDDFLLLNAPPAADPARRWESSAFPGNTSHRLYCHDGFTAFAKGGDVALDPTSGKLHVCWWAANGTWPNRVQGFLVPPGSASGNITQWWSSAGGLAIHVSAMVATAANLAGRDLRNHVREDMAENDGQALVLFHDPLANEQRVALFTPGARLIVLQRGTSATDIGGPPIELDAGPGHRVLDYGQGGLALAAGPARSVSHVDLYCAPVSFYAGQPATAATAAVDMVSALVRVDYQGSAQFSTASLLEAEKHVLDGSSPNWPKVHGVCGMTVGEIVSGHAGLELVVGSLDGHLLVYGLESDGSIGALLYATQVDGAVGAHNSLVICDIDGIPGNELYAAGTLGLWKWRQ